MHQMIQRFYSVDGKQADRPDRKKLKRQAQIGGSDMDLTDISQNSLLCGMQQFDRAVQNMEDTILVPSRLMDMRVQDDVDKQRLVPALLQSSEAYDVYRLLKSVRAQLRRGGSGAEADSAPGLQRRPSMLSSHSLCSLASDASSSGDSGHESEPTDDPCELVRAQFSVHLSGLGKCLAQMTEAAIYLCSRYEQQLNSGF
ncbi:mid1-interacting protein 1-B-like [Pollicipes pollicipes]|uniref:mid1-interacting protein 1-B-like n=1 Tax=Pollicipes pollicipes TaxID=41117 RepID=UPI001884971C|nr:mid1-interacting protein 1-B-like [Pollicipes pollicipes]